MAKKRSAGSKSVKGPTRPPNPDHLKKRLEAVRADFTRLNRQGQGESTVEIIKAADRELSQLESDIGQLTIRWQQEDLRRRVSRVREELSRRMTFMGGLKAQPSQSRAKGGLGKSAQPKLRADAVATFDSSVWAGSASEVAHRVETESTRWLAAYREQPRLVEEHANIERDAAEGGYGRRQIFELIQNGADALVETTGGRIQLVLTEDSLYCANEGDPIDVDGVDAILSSHVSRKRGHEIGRWGLGFKSVLGVTNRPEFFSRAGSFGFDGDEASKRIRAVVDQAERTPVLRVAQVLDPVSAATDDAVLRELMSWATTVVVLPLEKASSWLADDIRRNFPAEFLLFSSHVSNLILEDRTAGFIREITLRPAGDGVVELEEGSNLSSWRLFERLHSPSPEARKDGGELVDRPQAIVAWAVPVRGRAGRGKFWAFFPTKDETLVSGIINAPWKTHSDRHNLLEGFYNTELLNAAVAPLVVASLGRLVDPADPGRVLDVMPGRKDESPNWADRILHEGIYASAAVSPSLPDQDGQLAVPSSLFLHPAGISREALDLWNSSTARPRDWCHPSIETRERRYRAELLVTAAGRAPSSLVEWLEALVVGKQPSASRDALLIAELLVSTNPGWLNDIRTAEIVLSGSGELVEPDPDRLFFPGAYASDDPGLTTVHEALATDPDARRALESLGVEEVDASLELRSRIAGGFLGWGDEEWTSLWKLTRRLAPEQAAECFREVGSHEVKVRTRSGRFQPLNSVLLPGPVVPADESRDSDVVVDSQFHAPDDSLLLELGAVAVPTPGRGSNTEPWFWSYQRWAVTQYLSSISGESSRPQQHLLEFQGRRSFSGPLVPLTLLSEEGRSRFTEALSAAEADAPDWDFGHRTRPENYPTLSFLPPSIWLAKKEGWLLTSVGPAPISACLSPSMGEWKEVLPVPDISLGLSDRLDLIASLAELSHDDWTSAMMALETSTNDGIIGKFYAAAAEHKIDPPSTVRCRVGSSHQIEPLPLVTVVDERHEFDALVAQSVPVVQVSSKREADLLTETWGMRASAEVISTGVAFSSLLEAPLLDLYPSLRWEIDESLEDLRAVICDTLKLETLTESGRYIEEKSFHIEDRTVYWSTTLDDEAVLELLSSELSLDLSAADRQRIAGQRQDQDRRKRLAAIRRREGHAAKLLEALGVPVIRRRLPTGLIDAIEEQRGSLTEEGIADLALSVYGVEVLVEFRDELREAGFNPPTQWAGGRSARTFVRELGFPLEFAGFERAKRDPLLRVEGPPKLPALHDFQETISERVKDLVRGRSETRGLLSLPTGAGKTRIAVQSIIDLVKGEAFAGPVLWVAQSDELCEQAVQTWSDVWRARGPRGELSISRLWGPNEAEEIEPGPQVVVATIQKLQGCFSDDNYSWLRNPACLIVDEAHGSTEPMYTGLLEWVGLGRGKGELPLLGLTATPFRGTSREETERLVARYGRNRLDLDVLGDDPYKALQEKRVLARVAHRLVDGSDIALTKEEAEQVTQLRRLPASAEDRLGTNVARNGRLLESIASLPDDWSILLFATSVGHAQTMAALLRSEGISAAPIWGGTDPGARRHYIEEFRRGRLRVLTNYNVLTQGFDAPAVRALYAARPTFSPSLYQQMIGRGLRGPLNGGKDECLIVNVEDNVAQFGEELAFRQFEYLWGESR